MKYCVVYVSGKYILVNNLSGKYFFNVKFLHLKFVKNNLVVVVSIYFCHSYFYFDGLLQRQFSAKETKINFTKSKTAPFIRTEMCKHAGFILK